jgi:hypothetical protein
LQQPPRSRLAGANPNFDALDVLDTPPMALPLGALDAGASSIAVNYV